MPAIYGPVQSAGGVAIWLQGASSGTPSAPSAPSSVTGAATGSSTATVGWVDTSSDELSFTVQLEVPAGSGNWVAASGAANPTAAGVQTFAATGLAGATTMTPRVRSNNAAGSSAWVTGAAFTTENNGAGGGMLPAGPMAPTVTTHPGSQAVTTGALVTFTAAFAGRPTPTYQWRRGGVAIVGATSASYSFTTVLGDSGASFDCVATNTAGTVTTNQAVLTVNATAFATLPMEEFARLILPRAPTCAWPVAEQAVRQAAIEWFERTSCWRSTITVNSSNGAATYAMPVPPGAAVVRIMDARVDGERVSVLTAEQAIDPTSWRAAVWTSDRVTFDVEPVPGATSQRYDLTVALKPTQAALTIPLAQFEHHAESIASGALARLLRIKGKDWTDLTEAQVCFREFERRVATMSAQVSRGFARSRSRSNSVQF